MALIIKEIKLEVSRPNLIQAIVAKQNDCNSRFLKASIWDEGAQIPIRPESQVTINAERKDGKSDSFFGDVNDDNTVTVPLTSWMLELEGIVNCDVSIFVDDRKLTTTSFAVSVEKASNNSDDISTDPQYDVLVSLIEDVNELKDNLATVDQTYNPNSENAQSGKAVAQAIANAGGGGGGGSGADGKDGENGATFIPYVSTEGIISWTNDKGLANPSPVNIKGEKGDTGSAGKDGADGYTPVKGVDYFDGKNGSDGKDGSNGTDGISATHSWNGTTLTITSASGTSSANLKGDTGADGSNGKDGTSVTVSSVSESTADGGSNVVTFSDGKKVTIKNGSKGSTGATGPTGPQGPAGNSYVLTAADKAEIADMVVEILNGKPIVGIMDDNGKVMFSGLDYGEYEFSYFMEDGTEIAIGDLVLSGDTPVVVYTVSKTNTNCTINGSTTVAEGATYTASVVANDGYELSSVTVKMGGTDITASAYSNGNIIVPNVTGNIVITATATEIYVEPTNWIPISTDASGNSFGTNGIQNNARMSLSSGGLSTGATGFSATGFIPVQFGDYLYLENITISGEVTNEYITFYKSDRTSKVGGSNYGTYLGTVFKKDGNGYGCTLNAATLASLTSELAFIRFSSASLTNNTILRIKRNGNWL